MLNGSTHTLATKHTYMGIGHDAHPFVCAVVFLTKLFNFWLCYDCFFSSLRHIERDSRVGCAVLSLREEWKKKKQQHLTCNCAANDSLPFFSFYPWPVKWKGKGMKNEPALSRIYKPGIWCGIDNDARIQFKLMNVLTFRWWGTFERASRATCNMSAHGKMPRWSSG